MHSPSGSTASHTRTTAPLRASWRSTSDPANRTSEETSYEQHQADPADRGAGAGPGSRGRVQFAEHRGLERPRSETGAVRPGIGGKRRSRRIPELVSDG